MDSGNKNQIKMQIKNPYSWCKMCLIELMKGKARRKQNLHGKTAASVLLKLFISGNKSENENIYFAQNWNSCFQCLI